MKHVNHEGEGVSGEVNGIGAPNCDFRCQYGGRKLSLSGFRCLLNRCSYYKLETIQISRIRSQLQHGYSRVVIDKNTYVGDFNRGTWNKSSKVSTNRKNLYSGMFTDGRFIFLIIQLSRLYQGTGVFQLPDCIE